MLDTAPPADPAWNEQLERERQEEIQVISDACNVLGREIYEIQPDGHCMFSAVADQLGQMGMLPAHQVSRSASALAALVRVGWASSKVQGRWRGGAPGRLGGAGRVKIEGGGMKGRKRSKWRRNADDEDTGEGSWRPLGPVSEGGGTSCYSL